MLQVKLEFRQTQSLVITPQLQQAIKLLQLSNLELSNFLQQEIEKNPLLDWEDSAQSGGKTVESGTRDPDAEISPAVAGAEESAPSQRDGAAAEMGDHSDDSPAYEAGAFETFTLHSGGSGSSETVSARLEDLTACTVSLREHLRQQMLICIGDPQKRMIADYMIDLIDDAGYFRGSPDEVADRLSATEVDAVEVLGILQTLEPAGVGARSLPECLALQLKERNRFDPAMASLLDHLDLLADRNYAALQKLCGVDKDDLSEMISEILALDPRPGLVYGHSTAETVIPDIIVERDSSGNFRVRLNSETLPRISINRSFYASAKRMVRSEQDKSYLQNCMTSANWLARSLDQRRQTMLKVAREIVSRQAAFLENGVRNLKPLALKDIAERIGMHESTVSRVTSNKYMQTPRGTFELKYFFSSSIPASNQGDAHSSESVKHRIRQLVDNESPKEILSDDKIVALLRNDGVDIARRTVAKYRESMRIPSSVQRRRIKSSMDCLLADAER